MYASRRPYLHTSTPFIYYLCAQGVGRLTQVTAGDIKWIRRPYLAAQQRFCFLLCVHRCGGSRKTHTRVKSWKPEVGKRLLFIRSFVCASPDAIYKRVLPVMTLISISLPPACRERPRRREAHAQAAQECLAAEWE